MDCTCCQILHGISKPNRYIALAQSHPVHARHMVYDERPITEPSAGQCRECLNADPKRITVHCEEFSPA
eukprot:CAMPEP_0203904206 /NCGR_PEP_ID=MMETSP0359-20131031/46067_1 /ASSEMBLY_ACC=CAM_ASM_000338 /TAXON_ID=268821 /ORGANISM="Scrippsiella Hangoei, Strain SHTV-5" /LENGTH=68 /DNA_ID=CAMNT_0050828385 /DNA_START=331 /DNA_END=537 /DNA_ORIENTATION=+